MTVRRLLSEIDSPELSEWVAYYNIEPFGEERADLRQAITTCTLSNRWRAENEPPNKVGDFMMFSDRPYYQQSEAEMKMALDTLATFSRGKCGND